MNIYAKCIGVWVIAVAVICISSFPFGELIPY